jgi:hypothetical protein
MLVLIATECKIFFRDSQEKNEKNVEITEFYYQQNNQHVFNIGVWSLFSNSSSSVNSRSGFIFRILLCLSLRILWILDFDMHFYMLTTETRRAQRKKGIFEIVDWRLKIETNRN